MLRLKQATGDTISSTGLPAHRMPRSKKTPRRPRDSLRSRGRKSLYVSKTNSINVRTMRISGNVRRVGNGLAVLIPVREAKKAGIAAGDPVDVLIESGVPDAFGLLKDLPFRPFDRRKEGLWRDRI
jgi:hypothetical protein